MVETEKERLLKQLAQLKNERTSFEPHWRDLSDFINPRGSRFLTSDVNRDDRRNTKIVDPTGSLAQRILASGMMSGITSPARPWFKLATPDPDMMDYGPVKVWLEVVQRRMNEVFNKSNLYQSLPVMYASLEIDRAIRLVFAVHLPAVAVDVWRDEVVHLDPRFIRAVFPHALN
jgi:hypothetical protein